MASDVLVVFCSFPTAERASQVARVLVDEHLVACVNVLPAMQSIYRWQGATQIEAEVLAILKTTAARYDALELRLRALHPYECPEIIALPLDRGLPAYLEWVRGSLGEPAPTS